MKIEINVEKKHIYFLTGLLVILAGIVVISAIPPGGQGHPISQLEDSTGKLLDNDGNNIVDQADSSDTAVECENAATVGGYSAEDLNPLLVGTNCQEIENLAPAYNKYLQIQVPDGSGGLPDCLDSQCLIKLVIGSRFKQARYIQRTIAPNPDNKWSLNGGTYTYKNGDNSYRALITSSGGDNNRAILYDDSSASTGEKTSTQWTLLQDDSDERVQIFVCQAS